MQPPPPPACLSTSLGFGADTGPPQNPEDRENCSSGSLCNPIATLSLALCVCIRFCTLLGRQAMVGSWTGFHRVGGFCSMTYFLPSPGQESCSFYSEQFFPREHHIYGSKAKLHLNAGGHGPGWRDGGCGLGSIMGEGLQNCASAISPVASFWNPQTDRACHSFFVPGTQEAVYKALVFTSVNSQAIIIIEFSGAFIYCHLPAYVTYYIDVHEKTGSHFFQITFVITKVKRPGHHYKA